MSDGRRDKIWHKILSRVVVEDRGYDTPCFIWKGPTSGSKGRGRDYPRMSIDGGTVAVHIAVFLHFFGIIPPRKQIDHLCRQRLCVRPEHLEMVTHKKNQRRRDQARAKQKAA